MKKTFHVVDLNGKPVLPVELMMRPKVGEHIRVGDRLGSICAVTHVTTEIEGMRPRVEVVVNFIENYVPFDGAK